MTPKKMGSFVDAPTALASDGSLMVNVTHLLNDDPLVALRQLLKDGHQLFVGVVVPGELRGRLLKEVDDSLADVVGRVGVKLTEASARSSGPPASKSRGRPGPPAAHPRGRRHGP